MASLETRANELLSWFCQCITDFTNDNPDFVDVCKCFNNNDGDFCCNAEVDWLGWRPDECNGIFVAYLGTRLEEITTCFYEKHASFQVGITLCPPLDKAGNADKKLTGLYADCLLRLTDKIQQCLDAIVCDKSFEAMGEITPHETGFSLIINTKISYPAAVE